MEVGAYLRFVIFGTPPHYFDNWSAIVLQRVLLLATDLPKLAKISRSHPTAFHRLLETEFGKIFHHYETENVDNDEEWRQVKLATRRPLGARLSTLVSLSQSRGDFPSQPPRIYYADFLGCFDFRLSFSSSWIHALSISIELLFHLTCFFREGVKKKVLNYGWVGVKSPKLVKMWKYALFKELLGGGQES